MVDYDVDELELNGEYKCAFCKRWGYCAYVFRERYTSLLDSNEYPYIRKLVLIVLLTRCRYCENYTRILSKCKIMQWPLHTHVVIHKLFKLIYIV